VEGEPWPLERIGEVYPWRPGWTEQGALVELAWVIEVPVAREQLWPHLSDTSALNRALGLAPMVLEEVDGKVRATMGRGLTRQHWEELPWEWEQGRWMSYERVFSGGLARFLRSLTVLEAPEPNRTRVLAYTGMIARNFLGRAVFSAYMRRLRPRYEAILHEMARLAGAEGSLGRRRGPGIEGPARARANAAAERIRAHGIDAAVVDALVDHVSRGDELELHRLRVRPLARALHLDERALLAACVAAAHEGLLLLRWDVVCPHCRGLRTEVEHLGEIPGRGSCEPCGVDFETSDARALEITFRVHPSIRDIPERMYCAAEPATKHHIRIQRVLPPGERWTVCSLLPAGRYRMRTKGDEGSTELEIAEGASREEIEWPASRAPTGTVAPRPRIVLVNDGDRECTFVVEESERDATALRPAELFAVPLFRSLYADEALAVGIALDVGTQTILFTDVVGSTRYYLQAGDAVAFAEVRRQFLIAWAIVEEHGGVVVKTIGDAVMAAFRTPVDAVRAAIALQERFSGTGDCSLRLRVTVHSGSCLAVNLNTGVDYFGTTVNLAAKLQALVGAGEIAWTHEVDGDAEVRAELSARRLTPEPLEFRLTPQAEARSVRRVRIGPE
jgi:class 3 adenylate cyclase